MQRLNLEDRIHPIAAAVLDVPRTVRMRFCDDNSLMSQIISTGPTLTHRGTVSHAHVAGITLDDFYASTGDFPVLVKLDVEGSELAALRGSHRLLSEATRPALMIEYHPLNLLECNTLGDRLDEMLSGYRLYYISDLQERIPFGTAITSAADLQWICNLFAVPKIEAAHARWEIVLDETSRLLRQT